MKSRVEGTNTLFLFSGAILIAYLCIFSCASDKLFPYREGNESILVNNRLKITGTVCNEEPGTTILPVKILFIIDNSASMGQYGGIGSDPDQDANEGGSQRQRAVREVLDEYGNNPAYWFAQIKFSNLLEKCPTDPGDGDDLVFLNMDRAGYEQCIIDIQDPNNNTRMMDALEQAYLEILEDLQGMPSRLQRLTTYRVILLTDGVPDDGDADCVGGVEQPGQPSPEEDPGNVAEMAANIMTLADPEEEIRAKEITIDTVFLNPEDSTVERWGPCPGVDYEEMGRNLLESIANLGNGTFFETGIPEDLDFLQFVRTTIATVMGFKSFMAVNLNARLSGEGELLPDSDADGLTDAYESTMGMNPRSKDGDGDGLGDKVELKLGRDPRVASSTCDTVNLTDLIDTDYDLLNDCEERYLGTDDQLPDSDGDGTLDFLEIMYDTDPLTFDSAADNNQDGIPNAYEIAVHTEPSFAIGDDAKDRYAYRYSMEYEGLNEELIDCYGFEIGNISLVKPLSRPGYADGLNEILVYYIESLLDDPEEYGQATIGRYQAIYLGPGYKYPQLGVIEIDDFSDFNFVGKMFGR